MEVCDMKKYIYDNSNGLWYELQGAYYIPCLVLPDTEERPIGIWGRKHLDYIKENCPVLYTILILSGKLYSYLADIDTQARNRFDLLVAQMAWVRAMNNIRNRAEEIALKELFSRYTDAVREHQMTTDCLIFQNGFKLGARIMLEVMQE